MTPREIAGTARRALENAAAVVRRVIGVPDYEHYVAHVARCHPDAQPMSRDEFTRQRLLDRYNRPGSRCC